MTTWHKRKRKMSRRARGGITLLTLFLVIGWFLPTEPPIRIEEIPQIFHKTKATMNEKKHNKALAISYAHAGFGYSARERGCLITLWTRESRFDHLARNTRSTAYGIAQLLSEKSGDPAIQILHGLRYIQSRYANSACLALHHSNRTGWY